MATPDHRIPFALDKHGSIASIEEVENGAACACTCPSCSAPLIARQSKTGKTIWHFAHAKGYGCSGALETSLHLGVKRIIEEAGWLELPECKVVRYPDEFVEWLGKSAEVCHPPYSYRTPDLSLVRKRGPGEAYAPARRVEFETVQLEKREGDIRPDIVATAGGRTLFVEVAVHHPVDRDKLARIRARGNATIEISIDPKKGSWTPDELRTFVLENARSKAWLFNPRLEANADQDYEDKAELRLQIANDVALREAETLRRQQEYQQKIEDERRREREKKAAAQRELAVARAAKLEEIRRKAGTLSHRDNEGADDPNGLDLRSWLFESPETIFRRAQAYRTLNDAPPSPEYPVLAPVLFLDLDGLLRPRQEGFDDRVKRLAAVLGGRLCSVIVTSEIRRKCNAHQVAGMLRDLGGRHISVTPILADGRPEKCSAEIQEWMMRNRIAPTQIVVAHGTIQSFPAEWDVLISRSEDGFSDSDVFRLMELMANKRTWGGRP